MLVHVQYRQNGWFVFCFIEIASCHVTHTHLKLTIIPPQSLECSGLQGYITIAFLQFKKDIFNQNSNWKLLADVEDWFYTPNFKILCVLMSGIVLYNSHKFSIINVIRVIKLLWLNNSWTHLSHNYKINDLVSLTL